MVLSANDRRRCWLNLVQLADAAVLVIPTIKCHAHFFALMTLLDIEKHILTGN